MSDPLSPEERQKRASRVRKLVLALLAAAAAYSAWQLEPVRELVTPVLELVFDTELPDEPPGSPSDE